MPLLYVCARIFSPVDEFTHKFYISVTAPRSDLHIFFAPTKRGRGGQKRERASLVPLSWKSISTQKANTFSRTPPFLSLRLQSIFFKVAQEQKRRKRGQSERRERETRREERAERERGCWERKEQSWREAKKKKKLPERRSGRRRGGKWEWNRWRAEPRWKMRRGGERDWKNEGRGRAKKRESGWKRGGGGRNEEQSQKAEDDEGQRETGEASKFRRLREEGVLTLASCAPPTLNMSGKPPELLTYSHIHSA